MCFCPPGTLGAELLEGAKVVHLFGRSVEVNAEILRNEGLNAFTVADISGVDAAMLVDYDVVVLGEMAISGAQATMFADWVTCAASR